MVVQMGEMGVGGEMVEMGEDGRDQGGGVKECIEKQEKNITKKSKIEKCKQKIKSAFSNVSFSI